MKALPILIVEDDEDLREALCDTLSLSGYEVLSAADGTKALECIGRKHVGLIISDVQMEPMDGHALLREVKRTHPHIPVLIMTAYGMIEKAVEAMRDGACDYLVKPFEPDRLLAGVARYMLPPLADANLPMIAEDPATLEVLELARRVAGTDATVLITGESGTGKEVMARFIHAHSARASKPFVAINCAAIPENLLESTLFGYEKGSFTGAGQAHAGKFEQAQHGTLLLDEISEMPLALQAKLLRVLQEREVERVGGKSPIPLDIRVLATSNRDMQNEVRQGQFREDLYYRINVFPVMLPALRERAADIVPLAKHLLAQLATRMAKPSLALSPEAERRLTQYPWPGNIRELENVIQRAIILATGETIEPEHLYLPQTRQAEKRSGDDRPAEHDVRDDPQPTDIKSLEKKHILETLASVNGSRKQAAEKLGMSERTLRYKLQQYREEDGGLPG